MSRLLRLRYHAVDDERTGPQGASAPASVFRAAVPPGFDPNLDVTAFNSDADAARFYLNALFERDERPGLRGVLAPDDPQNVPDLSIVDTRDSPKTRTMVVRFEQRHQSIPVFGSHAIVELNRERELVSADASVGDVRDAPPVPSVEPREALEAIRAATGAAIELEALPPVSTLYFEDDADVWHLAWLFRDVPAEPLEATGAAGKGHAALEHGGHPPAPSPRDRSRVNYLVDAHSGDLLFYYSAAPTLNGALPPPIPAMLSGLDEAGQDQRFWGDHAQQDFLMSDPLRRTQTYDLGFADMSTAPALPQLPVSQTTANWVGSNRAAVTAHVNAQRVHDFYKGVLQRNGIDDAGMTLVSVVNCTWQPAPGARGWANAVWYEKKMWYGQNADASGRLVSMSRYLDVIAHELTHGVVEFSSALIYRGESGALNESFADVFGVIINNWYRAPSPRDVNTWNWEIGPAFRADGAPLRDLSDPTRTDDPDKYADRYLGLRDYGGVHTNSGINNKAVFNLLTGRDASGAFNFSVEDAALALYLCLTRLPPQATFSDARAGLIAVTSTVFSGNLAERDRKVAAIGAAYDAVGVN